MSSLAMTAVAITNPPGACYNESSNEVTMPIESPTSKGSNQMDTEEGEDLSKHLDEFMNWLKDEEEPAEEEISFGPSQTFFLLPSVS